MFDTSSAGTLTAGNSTPLTDGAAAVLLASEDWAKQSDLPVKALLTYGKTWAVDFASGKEGLLMAPAYAVSAMLRDANLSLQDFDFYEIHEAFAAQVLCTLKAWESPSTAATACIAMRRWAASTAASSTSMAAASPWAIRLPPPARASSAWRRSCSTSCRRRERGLISVCTAGGMGVTAIVERP